MFAGKIVGCAEDTYEHQQACAVHCMLCGEESMGRMFKFKNGTCVTVIWRRRREALDVGMYNF